MKKTASLQQKELGRSSDSTASPPKAQREPMNRNLAAAKAGKQDEFYTQYVDIQKEVEAYLEFDPDTFRGKVVYCNCDDPFESNFFKYFAANFNKLGLKKLVTTSYDGSPVAGAQLSFFEYDEGNGKRQKPKAIALEITEVKAVNGDGATGIENVKLFLKQNPHTRTRLAEGGDFRSPECIALLKEADIVVTNPPFSLFKQYIAQLVEHRKKFLIIGNVQAVTYLEVFPLIKGNKLWLGATIHSGDREFRVPDHYPLNAAGWRVDENGAKYIRVKGVRWYTNLDHGRRHLELPLMTMEDNLRFSKHKEIKGKAAYDRYDNYDAIEVPFTDAIPSDYDGVMGVPISFLDKYNPEQFEIIGNSDDGEMMSAIGARPLGHDFINAYRARGGTGHYSPGMRMLGLLEPQPRVIYKRILIRHRRKTRPAKARKK
ncbi:adenine-specific methyltransferase EcoRI family protein [Cupriavidus necator]|uniref:adenine-specific methyltransferase EcoRI family protein n=1 Tax=Cupriavidus necator TaxID=106590 RepID=UPI00339D53E3